MPGFYFGFAYTFKQIDKSLPLSYVANSKIKGKGAYRWSASLGIGTSNFENNTFQGFYKNFGLLAGVNDRVERQIRFGAGLGFVNQKNPNPILNSQILTPLVYANINFDFSNL